MNLKFEHCLSCGDFFPEDSMAGPSICFECCPADEDPDDDLDDDRDLYSWIEETFGEVW